MIEHLSIIGACLTAALGIMGLFAPTTAARFIGLSPDEQDAGLVGKSELRATYGGFFCGLGIALLYFASDTAYVIAGIAWLSAAAGRMLSLFLDLSRSAKNIGGVLFEALIGACSVSPSLVGVSQ